MENWREDTRSGHTHEPNDVTVQVDGTGRQVSGPPLGPGTPGPSDGPVFVDESGRRSKTYRRAGWALATICAVYAVTLVVSVLGGNSSAPWLPLSGHEKAGAEEIEVRPAPSDDVVSESPAVMPSAPAPASAVATLAPAGGPSASGPVDARASTSASASSAPAQDTSSSDPVPAEPTPEESTVGSLPSLTPEPPVEESPSASPAPSESPVKPHKPSKKALSR